MKSSLHLIGISPTSIVMMGVGLNTRKQPVQVVQLSPGVHEKQVKKNLNVRTENRHWWLSLRRERLKEVI